MKAPAQGARDNKLSKDMMKIVRMRLLGFKMSPPPKAEVKIKVAERILQVIFSGHISDLSTFKKKMFITVWIIYDIIDHPQTPLP